MPTEGAVGDRRRISHYVDVVPTVTPDDTIADVRALGESSFPVPVVDDDGVLFDAIHPSASGLPPATAVRDVMVPAPGTIRPELRVSRQHPAAVVAHGDWRAVFTVSRKLAGESGSVALVSRSGQGLERSGCGWRSRPRGGGALLRDAGVAPAAQDGVLHGDEHGRERQHHHRGRGGVAEAEVLEAVAVDEQRQERRGVRRRAAVGDRRAPARSSTGTSRSCRGAAAGRASGAISGRVTRRSVAQRPAPSSAASSYRSSGISRRVAMAMRKPSPIVNALDHDQAEPGRPRVREPGRTVDADRAERQVERSVQRVEDPQPGQGEGDVGHDGREERGGAVGAGAAERVDGGAGRRRARRAARSGTAPAM